MKRLLFVLLLILNPVYGADYVGRMSDEVQKGGDSSLGSSDTPVSPNNGNPPDEVLAPDLILAGEASEDWSQLPDSPAPPPFIASEYVHTLEVGNHRGSCVYLGNGLFITCAHIFENNPEKVIKIDGKQYGGKRTALFDVDLAYLEMNKIPEWRAAKVSVREVDDKTILYGMTTKEHRGTRSEWKSGKEVYIDLPNNETVEGGDSGGGVFSEAGELLGVITLRVTGYSRAGISPLSLAPDRLPIKHLLPEKEVAPTPPQDYTQSPNRFLLFSADWCGPCKPAKTTILPEVEKQTGNVVEVINTDTHADLVKRYKVTGIPLWVLVDEDGNELDRQVNGSVESLVTAYSKYK